MDLYTYVTESFLTFDNGYEYDSYMYHHAVNVPVRFQAMFYLTREQYDGIVFDYMLHQHLSENY